MGSIDTPQLGIRPDMGENEIRRILKSMPRHEIERYIVSLSRGEPLTIRRIEEKRELELKLILMGMVKGVDSLTAEEIHNLPREEMEYHLLKQDAQMRQLRNADVETRAGMETGHEAESNSARRKGIAAILWALKNEQMPTSVPPDASDDTKQIVAFWQKMTGYTVPMDIRLKKAVEEKELADKKAEEAENTYDAKVKVIGEKAEVQIKAEKQKFDAGKAAIEKTFTEQTQKLAGEIRVYESKVAGALIKTLGLADRPEDASKIEAIKNAGAIQNLFKLEEILSGTKTTLDLAQLIGNGAVQSYMQELLAHKETKGERETERLGYDEKSLKDGKTIGEQRAEIAELQDAKVQLEEIARKYFKLKEIDLRLRATLAEARTDVRRERELTGAQRQSIEDAHKANESQVEFVSYARAQLDNLEKFKVDAIIADRKEFRKAALRRAVFLGIPVAALSFIVGNVYIALGYLQRSYEQPVREVNRTVYVQGPERVVEKTIDKIVEVPGPERVVEKPVDRVVYVDKPAPVIPVEIPDFTDGKMFVTFGKETYSVPLYVLTGILKEIRQEELTLKRELSPAERKQHYDAHVKEKIVDK